MFGKIFGSGPDLTIPKAGKNYWLSSMAAINNLLGDEGPFGQAGMERQKSAFAEDVWRSLRGDATDNYSLAARGITPSGADFGRIRGRQAIAANDRDVVQNALMARLQALMGQNSGALAGIQGGAIQGQSGWLSPLLQAGASLAGSAGNLGWKPFK